MSLLSLITLSSIDNYQIKKYLYSKFYSQHMTRDIIYLTTAKVLDQ